MLHVSLEEAKTHLPNLINVAVGGKDVFMIQNTRRMVRLLPVAKPKPHPRFGSARGLIAMAGDFDAPLADLEGGGFCERKRD